MQVNNQVSVNKPEVLKSTEPPKKETTLDKMGNFVHENTKEGTFIGDNMVLTGAGTLVGLVATGSAVAKAADKFPAVEKALEFVFVENGKLVGAGLTGAAAAILAEDAKASLAEGDTAKAVGLGSAAAVSGLGAIELTGRQFDIPVARRALSKPVEVTAKFIKDHAGAIGGTAFATGGAFAMKSGVEDLQNGETMFGIAKLGGGSLAVLGGAELFARNYNIPVLNKALSGPAEWVGENVKAVTGVAAVAGGGFAIKEGLSELKDGNKWLGADELAGGAVGVLGGAELVGRNFNIPILNQALTGPVKALFTSKGGIIASGAAISTTGLAAAGDGVRRLTTEKGIVNDAIGVAEFTAGVAGVTGGASIIGYATGSEKLMRVFPENADVIGGAALVGGAVALGKHAVDSAKEEGVTLLNTATGTGAALMGLGGGHVIAHKFGVEAANTVFVKGYQTAAAAGLGLAAYKLGEHTLEQGKAFVENPGWGKGAAAAGLGVATVAAGATSMGLVGHAYNIPVLKNASTQLLNGVKTGVEKTATAAFEHVIEPTFNAAVKHPFATLGVLAVAGGVGYYMYKSNQEEAK